MTITDILWPWGALHEARAEAAAAIVQAHIAEARAEQLRSDLDASYRRNRSLEERNLTLSRGAAHHRYLLANSHFRNPETGRIGKRGEYPEAPQ